jgi:hypothetical protein
MEGRELTDFEIDEHMNKEVHCVQKPKNFVRTLRKWIMDKSKYLTADEISGFATLNQGTVLSPWTIADNFQRGQRGSNSVWVFLRLNIPMFARGQGHFVTPDFVLDLLVGIVHSGGLK